MSLRETNSGTTCQGCRSCRFWKTAGWVADMMPLELSRRTVISILPTTSRLGVVVAVVIRMMGHTTEDVLRMVGHITVGVRMEGIILITEDVLHMMTVMNAPVARAETSIMMRWTGRLERPMMAAILLTLCWISWRSAVIARCCANHLGICFCTGRALCQ